MSPSEQEGALASGEIDLALLGAASPSLKRRYHTRAVRVAHMAAVVPADHPLSPRRATNLTELDQDTFITLDAKHFPNRPPTLTRLFERAKIKPDIAAHASGLTELLGLVSAGVGAAVVPDDLIRLAYPGVSFIRLKSPRLKLISAAVWRKETAAAPITDLVDLIASAGRR